MEMKTQAGKTALNMLIAFLYFVAGILGLGFGYVIYTPKEPQITRHNYAQVQINKPAYTPTPTEIAQVEPLAIDAAPAYAQVQIVQVNEQPAIVIYDQPAQVAVQDAPPIVIEPAVAEPTFEPVHYEDIQPTSIPPIIEEYLPQQTTSGPVAQIIQPVPVSLMELSTDELWDMAASGELAQYITEVCPAQMPQPNMDWNALDLAAYTQTDDRNHEEIKMHAYVIAEIVARGGGYFPSEGYVRVDEEGEWKKMLAFLWLKGELRVCKDANGRPNAYGPGVQTFLNQLAASWLYY